MSAKSKSPLAPDVALIERIRELITAARSTVARGVDLVQVHTAFEIGRHIVEHEQQGRERADYGKALLIALADRLTVEFGRGFSLTNLKLMRQFYVHNADRIGQTLPDLSDLAASTEKGQTATGQLGAFRLSWSHFVFLMGIKNVDERRFYEIEAADQGWTVRELKRQFDSSLYERLALSRDKDGIRELARAGQIIARPHDVLKEPLVLEFLGLAESARYSESDLETAIIGQIQQFLLELGKGFLFEARQKRFTFDADHFFVDLARMFHEGTRMIAKGFAPESRREEKEWLFHCDDEQRRVRRKERARAALARKWQRTVCHSDQVDDFRAVTMKSGHFLATS